MSFINDVINDIKGGSIKGSASDKNAYRTKVLILGLGLAALGAFVFPPWGAIPGVVLALVKLKNIVREG